jgi:arginine decarboxylase
MSSTTKPGIRPDQLFTASATRLDLRRALNAAAQTWAAATRGANPRGGRAAVEAALADVRPLEEFFAYPVPRLTSALAECIAATCSRCNTQG